MPVLQSIDATYADGLNPSLLDTHGDAILGGDGVVALTTGEPGSTGAVSHRMTVDTTRSFTARWFARFGVGGGGARKCGFGVWVVNHLGYTPGLEEAPANRCGSQWYPQFGVVARVDSGVTSISFHRGDYQGDDSTEPPTHTGTITADLATGDEVEFTLQYTKPTSGNNGSVVLSARHGVTTTSRTYTGLADLQALFDDAAEEPGDRAYVSAIAVTPDDADNLIEIWGLEWTTTGVTPPAVTASGSWTAPAGASKRIAAAEFDSLGRTRRQFCGGLTLRGGEEYLLPSTGLDEDGEAISGQRTLRLAVDNSTVTPFAVGNSYFDPEDRFTGLTGIIARSIAASPDGTFVAGCGWGGDTLVQSGLYPLDVDTGHVRADLLAILREYSQQFDRVRAEDGSAGYLYGLQTDDAGAGDDRLRYWVVRYRTKAPDLGYRIAFSGTPHTHADGTRTVIKNLGGDMVVWELEDVADASELPAEDRYLRDPDFAIGTTALAACLRVAGKVVFADKETAAQAGDAITVAFPRAVCELPNGNWLVAHGDGSSDREATVLSVYHATTHALIGTLASAPTVADVSALSCVNGLLAIADDGYGVKSTRVYTVSGNGVTGSPFTLGGPADFMADDDPALSWHLYDVQLTTAGDIYVAKSPPAVRERGGQLMKFSADGTFQWSKDSHGYTTAITGGFGPEGKLGISSNMRRFEIDAATGEYRYLGSAWFPGMIAFGPHETNPFTSTGTGQVAAPMRRFEHGGEEYLSVPADARRCVILKHLGDAYFRPVAMFRKYDATSGNESYWVDSGTGGFPEEADITYVNVPGFNQPDASPQVGADGALWFVDQVNGTIHRNAGRTSDGEGYPYFHPSDSAEFAAAGAETFRSDGPMFLAPDGTGGACCLVHDEVKAPYPSSSNNGNNTIGACRVLLKFAPDGTVLASCVLGESAQSIDATPERVVVTGRSTSRVYLFDASLLCLSVTPPATRIDHSDFPGGTTSLWKLPDGDHVYGMESIVGSAYCLGHISMEDPTYYSAAAEDGETVELLAEGGGGTAVVKVRHRLSGGKVKWRNRRVEVQVGSPPGVPTSLVATAANSSSIGLTWAAPGGGGQTGYILHRSDDGSTGWAQIATPAQGATSYTDTGLDADEDYYYRLAATNASGSSAYTSVASDTTDEESGLSPAPAPGSISDHAGHHMSLIDVPVYGQSPTHYLELTGGVWSDPAVWSTGTVPTATSDVQIQAGATVTIDDTSAVARYVVVQGTLARSRSANTRLTCDHMTVMGGGLYEIGTPASPIPVAYTAEHVIRDSEIDTEFDPEQWGGGLLVTGALHSDEDGDPIGESGVIRMCGHDRTPTFVRLAVEPEAGDTVLTLGTSVTGKWRVGDTVDLPDTRCLDQGERSGAGGWPVALQYEQREIIAIAGDGLSITLDSALTYDHLGGRDTDGNLDFLPHVANVTRNVRVYSENPDGVRGHCAFMHRADVDLRHAEFRDLGRTLNAPLDSTTFDGSGNPTHIGTNQIGRYPVHFHHCSGPAGGVSTASGFPAESPRQNQGCAYGLLIHNPSQIGDVLAGYDASIGAHWGLVGHASSYLYFGHNVVADYTGALIVEEDGTERENIIEDNYMTRCYGNGDRLGAGFEGAAYFARSGDNRVRRNVATNYGGSGVYSYGYVVFGYQLGGGNSPAGSVLLPLQPGVDMHHFEEDDGVHVERVDAADIPFREWHDNESYGGQNGMTFWWVGTSVSAKGLTGGTDGGTILRQDAWHVWGWGFFYYDNKGVVVDYPRVYGDNHRQIPGVGSIRGKPMGIYPSDYPQVGTVTSNGRFETVDFVIGQEGPQQTVGTDFLLQDCTARCTAGIFLTPAAPQSGGVQLYGERHIVFDNCKFDTLAGSPALAVVLRYRDRTGGYDAETGAQTDGGGYAPHVVARQTMTVLNHRQVPGDDFKVYYAQQDPAYVPVTSSGTFVGSPESGLTNQQLHDKYEPWSTAQAPLGVWTPVLKSPPSSLTDGVCVCGELLPAGASNSARSDIFGYTEDI